MQGTADVRLAASLINKLSARCSGVVSLELQGSMKEIGKCNASGNTDGIIYVFVRFN